MQKFAPQGIVSQSFTHTDIDNAIYDQLVQISGDMTVSPATNGRVIGRVITLDVHTGLVVVELFASQILECIVGATAVVAGNKVKSSATTEANNGTVIPAATATVPADIDLAFAIALNGGATGATINVVPL